MGIAEAYEYILFLEDKEQDELIFHRWVTGGYERVVSFDEFKQELIPVPIKNDEEILQDLDKLMSKYSMEGGADIGNI